jgi:hypothetical protein
MEREPSACSTTAQYRRGSKCTGGPAPDRSRVFGKTADQPSAVVTSIRRRRSGSRPNAAQS